MNTHNNNNLINKPGGTSQGNTGNKSSISLIMQVLKRNERIIFFCLVIFFSNAIAGYLLFEETEDILIPFFQELVSSGIVVPESPFMTALNILVKNIVATLMMLITGITVIIPVLIVSINGFLLGFVVKFVTSQGLGLSVVIKGIVPHGIFELPALFIAAASGIRIGISLICPGKLGRRNAVVLRIKEAITVYIVVVTPLLVVAAFIEAFITAWLVL